jgi:hypothetical protein
LKYNTLHNNLILYSSDYSTKHKKVSECTILSQYQLEKIIKINNIPLFKVNNIIIINKLITVLKSNLFIVLLENNKVQSFFDIGLIKNIQKYELE